LQRDLPTGAGQQIGAPHHIGHVLRLVIHDHGELVSDYLILALDHEVPQLTLFEPAKPLYSIVEEHHRTVSEAQARGGWNAASCWSGAAGPGVTGVFAVARAAPCAAALEGAAAGLELVHGRKIKGDAAALVYDLAVPVQAEGIQGSQDPVRAAGNYAGGVEILDPQQPAAAMVAGIQVAADRRQKRSQVQVARRGGGEAAYVFRRAGCSIPLAGAGRREALVGRAPISGSGRLGRRTDVRGAPGAPGLRCSG
jgi:hypothetical protein